MTHQMDVREGGYPSRRGAPLHPSANKAFAVRRRMQDEMCLRFSWHGDKSFVRFVVIRIGKMKFDRVTSRSSSSKFEIEERGVGGPGDVGEAVH
jgi:hypothetical protein